MFETADGLPYIAEHPRYPQKLYVATGFNGNGMVMRALAGMILADLATGRVIVHAKLFDFSRTSATMGTMETSALVSAPAQPTPAARRSGWRWIATLVYVFVLVLPGYVFFNQRGGFSFLAGLDFKTFNLVIFPLVGLYAFTLLWSQFVIGAARSVLRSVVHPAIITFHRRQGVLIFLLAWLHPTLRFFGIGLDQYFKSWNVAPSLVPYLWLGYLQLFLLTLTAGTALLRKLPWLKTRWHTIHYVNYGVFVMVWIHSWFLGSDVRSTNLRYLWWFFAVTALAATAVRIRQIILKRKSQGTAGERASSSPEPGGGFVPIATVDQFNDRTMICATVNGKPLALFKVGEQYFCLDNTCSHAGGPLCEGLLEGTVIECPLHASRFDVTTGAVVAGPAHEPQRTYPIRLNGSRIEVAM
ncbi:MAG: Rieske 2Fe-2S domain-containing protein [Candidatus Kerfeldbacteria bacterium]|nr:Rieske 2Fe-2S domain-containing protein [Candidatus Kerfeldbacteria bacterium]